MKIRGHGNVVAITLAALAVVLAATGTAVAVTATTVKLVDPVHPARAARVDSQGRVTVATPAPPLSTINVGFFVPTGLIMLTTATTATLGITRLALFNTGANSAYPNTNFDVTLVKVTPPSGSSDCYTGSSTSAAYSVDRIPIGSDVQDLYTVPLRFAPTAGAPYCIGVSTYSETGSPGSYYLPFVQLTAHVISGSYPVTPTAPGASAGAVGRVSIQHPPLRTPRHPHPVGAASQH